MLRRRLRNLAWLSNPGANYKNTKSLLGALNNTRLDINSHFIARIQLDNISLSCAVNEFSQAWQWDTECSIELALATR